MCNIWSSDEQVTAVKETIMTTYTDSNKTKLVFEVSSEIFSFNAMIETCRSFLFNLGYTEISSMYIVLRELVFNTIINAANNEETCVFNCTIELVSEERFKVSVTKTERCSHEECFKWISRNNKDIHMDRVNRLIYNNIDSIEIDAEDNTITIYISLTKTERNKNTETEEEVHMIHKTV